MTLDDIKEVIKNNSTFVIFAHENPDGDAVGSCLAMYNVLKNLGKKVEVVMDEHPASFSYLQGEDKILQMPTYEIYDVAMVLDCPDLKRVREKYQVIFNQAKNKIEFDHHINNSMFADLCVVDQACPACSQLLASSFNYLGFEITKPVAECLLTGIITDTGGFRHDGTNSETFEFAAWCMTKGLNINKIYHESMMLMTKTKFEEEKLAMERMEFLADGKIAFTYITKEDDEKIGIEPGDHDGIVEIGRNIKGVEVSIFLYQKDDGMLKASLRSNDYVDVSEICILFGGGGHIKAAGTNLKMTFDEAKKALVNETIKHLK